MAGSATGSTGTSSLMGAFHEKRLLEVLDNTVVFYQLADKRPIAVNNGTTITFHNVTALGRGELVTEGTEPDPQFMTSGTVTATIMQIADKTKWTTLLAKSSVADMRAMAADRLGQAAAETLDANVVSRLFSEFSNDTTAGGTPLSTLDYNGKITTWYKGILGGLSSYVISSNMNELTAARFSAFYSTAADNADTNADDPQMKMTLKKLRKMVGKLKADNVKPYDNAGYVMVSHSTAIMGLREDAEWATWNQYQNAEKMFKGEVGMVEGIRIIESNNATKYNHGLNARITAYLNVILGKGAFACTEFAGDSGIKYYEVLANQGGDSNNVLRMTDYAGYVWTGAIKVLNSKCGYGLISIHTPNN